MQEVTLAQIDQAEARLADAKTKNPDDKQAAMNALAELRSAWRAQEEAAGRRTGIVKVDE